MADTNPLVLKTLPDTYGHTQAIKDGTLSSPRLAFDFVDIKPVSSGPAVMLNRFHHGSIVKKTGGPITGPKDLNGKKIGVRAYTQTTGVWVRGILGAEYGVDLDRGTNVTNEAATSRITSSRRTSCARRAAKRCSTCCSTASSTPGSPAGNRRECPRSSR